MPAKAQASAQPATKGLSKPLTFSSDTLNRGLVAVSVLVMVGVLFMGWLTLNGGFGQPDDTDTPPSVSQATATPAANASSLKLNQPHQRYGAIINADPSLVGRTGNPLTPAGTAAPR